LLEKYATSAPRYTSYPTAVDWTSAFDTSRYPELLVEAAREKAPLSVYVHIPFCAERCLFCGCNVVITRNEDRVERYLERLQHEFDSVRASGVGARAVHQYHWGGGTPTHLSLEQIARVQTWFGETFHLAPDAEVAIEVDPRVTTDQQITVSPAWDQSHLARHPGFDRRVQEDVQRVQSRSRKRVASWTPRAAGSGLAQRRPDLRPPTRRRELSAPSRSCSRSGPSAPRSSTTHVPWIKKSERWPRRRPDSATKLAVSCARSS
jgi:oxygen-independent coproporphyrinogen-3 oxidase